MTPPPTCRECHQRVMHKLSCSRVRYDGRTVVAPTDTVAPEPRSTDEYCPGPDVACYYGIPEVSGTCRYTGTECYYRVTNGQDGER